MNNIETALQIAFEAHKGQKDKAGQPYILHPIRVAMKCETDEERIVALLHDVLEDSDFSSRDLLECGLPQSIVDAVLSLTRMDGEDYFDFIRRCNLHPVGRVVKMHDLKDNMDVTRLEKLTSSDCLRTDKYLAAYKYLTKAK